jgi:Zn-dependent protease with chaperone function
MTRKPLFVLVAACAALAARAVGAQGVFEPVPLKDQEQRLIEESQELNGYFERQSLLYTEPNALALVERVGRSVAPPPTDGYQQYRFFILRDPSPNAFALPNGHIYVHTGMLARLADTAQLAALLAHEVNHVAGHHSIVDFRSTNKKLVASMVLTGVFGGIGGLISTGLYTSMYGFNRELEQEADDRAVAAMLASPYDAHALPEIYEVLAQDYEGIRPRVPTIWSTHPQLEARAARTRGQVAAAPVGERNAEEFESVALPIRTMTIRDYIQDDYPRTAIALAEDLSARYPDKPELLALLGDAWIAMGPLTEFDEDELSNLQRSRNANRRLSRTRQERAAAALETAAGREALRANLTQARVVYERALVLDAEFAPAYRGLGEAAEGLGEPRIAAQAYVDYLRKDPEAADRAVILQKLRTLRDQLRAEETGNAATNR